MLKNICFAVKKNINCSKNLVDTGGGRNFVSSNLESVF
ncbi:MAG: hypothetical protein RL757_924 [Bacteroidota bacterium]|jgi:hypothetical protein